MLSLKPGHQAYRSPPRFRIGVPPLSGLLTCYAETTVGFGIVCYKRERESELSDLLERPKGQYIEYIGDTPQTLE